MVDKVSNQLAAVGNCQISFKGELAYNLMSAVKNPDKDYSNEAEEVNSIEP